MALASAAALDAAAGAMLQEALRRTHLSTAADVGAIASEEARTIGVSRLVLYLVEYGQERLVPVPAPDAARREPLSVGGTIAGRCFTASSIIVVRDDGNACRMWIPLLDGTERLGVVELTFEQRDRPLPDHLVAACERYAHFLAGMVVTKSAYSDFFHELRGRAHVTPSSELLWSLVPPMVLAADGIVLGALLEPWDDLGGDAFDYALDGNVLHFAVFDAMGHDLTATGVTAFALAAYRRSRRRGLDLPEMCVCIDEEISQQQASRDRFVTALLARLDVATGELCWVRAGHPPLLLLRDDRLVRPLRAPGAPPLGMSLATTPPNVARESLQPGDRILAYTDGLTEARRPDGRLFTVERLGEFIERQAAAGRAAPETLRRLRQAILGGTEARLRDDATALLIEWRRGGEQALLPQTVLNRRPRDA